jgi:nucleoside-diphosphate-sugar epimerase
MAGLPPRGTVLVTGAAGAMGTRLVRGLREAGWTVRALVLPADPLLSRLDGLGCDIREGDVAALDSLAGVCDGIDVVYHLAAVIISHDDSVFRRVNYDGTANMVAAAARARVRHFVYVSSASVTYPRRTPYAESKLMAEGLVRGEPVLKSTVVRPTLAYDEHGGQEFLMFLRYLKAFPIVPFIGSGKALKRPVWTGDIVDGLLRLPNNPVSYGKTYNFSGGEAISMLELARLMLRHHADRSRPIVSVPVPMCRALAFALRWTMARPFLTMNAIAGVVNDADLDPTQASIDLGYRPVGVHEGFQKCFPIARQLGTAAPSFPLSPSDSSEGKS